MMGSSSSFCRPQAESWTFVCAKACARCGRAPARARSTKSWRSRRGRESRKHVRCSCRGTTKASLAMPTSRGRARFARAADKRTACGSRAGPSGWNACIGEPPAGCARPRRMARGRSLVDGGAGVPALLRSRAAVRGERRCLSRRGALLLVHPAGCLGTACGAELRIYGRPPAARRIEEVCPVERECAFARRLVRKLEDHRVLVVRKAADHLAAALDRRHSHHLAKLDVVVSRREIVGELVVAGARVHSALLSEKLVKVPAWRMHVEQACTTATWVGKRMDDPDRRRDERAGAEAQLLVAEQELRLAFEHVERIDVVVVAVRVGARKAGLKFELDERELVTADLDRRNAIVRLEPFALSGAEEDRAGRRRAGAGWHVDAVETARLAAVPRAQMIGEIAVGRVEVEKARDRKSTRLNSSHG